jgi:hypothetical protein
MGLEMREYAVVPPTANRAATAGDLPRLVLYKPDGTPFDVGGSAAAQADSAALTSSAATGGDAPTEAEYNALRTDVSNIRTTLNGLLAKMRTAGLLETS